MASRLQATAVIYVPPHSLLEQLEDMAAVLGGDRRCCVARELTKLHETFYRGSLSAVRKQLEARRPRGEMVVILAGSTAAELAADARTAVCSPVCLATTPRHLHPAG